MGSIVFLLIEDEVVTVVDNYLQPVMNGNELGNEDAVNLLPPKTQDYSRPEMLC